MNINIAKSDPFDVLLDIYVKELRSKSDTEALEGADPALVKKEGLAMLATAKAKAGKRRLNSARTHLSNIDNTETHPEVSLVSPQEVRAFLRKAANDTRYTLAARGLDEMSEADALQLYQQLKRLEVAGEASVKDPL